MVLTSARRGLAKAFLSMGGVGLMPFAPGTWGSAAGALLLGACHAALPSAAAALGFDLLLLLAVGALSLLAMRALPSGGHADEQFIVTDELMGMTIAYAPAAFLHGHPLNELLAAFVLFRIFDVWKPLLIGRIDALKTPLAVLLDDCAAGLVAALCLWAAFA